MKSKKPRTEIDNVPVWCSHDEIVECSGLVPNPKNPNTHPKKQIALLGKIIKTQGWRMPITVSKRSGFIVKGHGRLDAAVSIGLSQAPVDYQEYKTEADEWADMVADNRLAELAEIDKEKLSSLISELRGMDVDIELSGFTVSDVDNLFPEERHGLTDDDDVPALEEKAVSKIGDLYILGDHRLLCGSSTEAAVIDRLMGGALPIWCSLIRPITLIMEIVVK